MRMQADVGRTRVCVWLPRTVQPDARTHPGRAGGEREVHQRFEETHTRPFDELIHRLKRVGL